MNGRYPVGRSPRSGAEKGGSARIDLGAEVGYEGAREEKAPWGLGSRELVLGWGGGRLPELWGAGGLASEGGGIGSLGSRESVLSGAM